MSGDLQLRALARRAVLRPAAAALAAACLAGCAGMDRAARAPAPMRVVRRPSGPAAKPVFRKGESVELPFYVLNHGVVPPARNFALSGFMGDITDVSAVGTYTNLLVAGRAAMKVKYIPAGHNGWAGAVWQNPANNWGTFDGGYNLGGATKLMFWARGEKGGEVVEFTVGGAAANFPDSDQFSTGPILLDREWTEYTLPLAGRDLFYIATGFGFVVKHDQNPYGCVFYLDDIRYEK